MLRGMLRGMLRFFPLRRCVGNARLCRDRPQDIGAQRAGYVPQDAGAEDAAAAAGGVAERADEEREDEVRCPYGGFSGAYMYVTYVREMYTYSLLRER